MLTTQSQPRVLALVGMPGSGKSLCAHHLQERGYFQFRFGGIVVDEVKHRGWAVRPENERIVREELRAREGMDAIAKRALPLLQEALDRHPSIVIDGLYSWSEYKTLRRDLGVGMVLVAITSPRWMRYNRLATRDERPRTAEEAEQRDYQEIERLEKGGPIAIADFTIINDRAPADMLRQLDAITEQLALQP